MGDIVWLKKWSHPSHHRKIKKKLAEPTTVYVIILLLVISYVGFSNADKIQLSISGFATSGPTPPASTQPASISNYKPPAMTNVGCGSPCELLNDNGGWTGEIGVKDVSGVCLPVKQYYDEKHCCVDLDCPINTKCTEGLCKSL
jgi:hypothetical protein